MSRADLERVRKLEITLRALLKAVDAYKYDLTYETNWRLMACCTDAKRILKGDSDDQRKS
jgi:hypothetical protein